MTIENCPKCGGTHWGSNDCPYIFLPCVVCGDMTHFACSDCAIDSGGRESVHVCSKTSCQDAHEATHAERKEVMPHDAGTLEVNSWGTEARSSDATTPPTAGPSPPAGALAGWKLFQEMLAAAPSPQPAPAEGAPDGARLMDVIKVLRGWADVGDFQQHERGVLRKAAAALTAQADEIVADMAEIAAGRERAEKAEAALAAKEAECERLRSALDRLGSVEAFHVSQPIDGPLATELQMRIDFACSALSGKEQP